MELIPDEANYIDSISRTSKYVIFPDKYPGIYLQKYDNKWYYSEASIRAVEGIYQEVIPAGAAWLQGIAPQLGQRVFLGMKVWKYIGILIVVILAVIMYAIVNRIFAVILRKILPRFFSKASESVIEPAMIRPLAHPLTYLLLTLLIQRYFLPMLILPISVGKPAFTILTILASVFGVLFFLRLVDILAKLFLSLAEKTDSTMDDQLVPLLAKGAKLIIMVFGALFILDNLEVNVTALLAGVSIGGLAIALAAQDTVRNLIGSVSIFIDRPFTIGDFIEAGGISGTVTEVGVRTTRIRASDGAIISFPNGDLASKVVTNHSTRTYRRYATSLTITYNARPDQIESFVEGVRNIVVGHPKTRDDSVIVHFHEMSSSSLDIFYAAIFDITAYAEWLEARQEIFLEVMKLAQEKGIDFAFPSTSVYIESMPAKNEESSLN